MIFSLDTLDSSPAFLATREPPSAAPAGRRHEPAPASLDDLVAMCRGLGVGTGLLRACQREADARLERAGDTVTGTSCDASVYHERNAQCREANGFWV
jgi:hypothetical protein